jgi:hypothetical protein
MDEEKEDSRYAMNDNKSLHRFEPRATQAQGRVFIKIIRVIPMLLKVSREHIRNLIVFLRLNL